MQKHKTWFEKYHHIIAVFLIIIVSLPIYLQSINTPFFYDDIGRIKRNLDYMHTLPLGEAFVYPIPSRPLFNLVIYVFSLLNVKSPIYFHIFSISIHILNSVLLYVLLNRFKNLFDKTTTLYISLLFLIHPLSGESVHYIHSFSVLLSTFFILVTAIFFSDYFLKADFIRYNRLGLSFVSAFLAYISKETSIILPLLLILVLVCLLKRRLEWKHFPIFAIYFLESSIIIFLLVLEGNAHKDTAGFSLGSPFAFLFTQLHYSSFATSLFFLPFNQSIYHDLTMQDYHLSFGFIPGMLFIIIFITSIFQSRTNPLVNFSILWMGISILPTNTLYPILDIITEYRLYLALIGFCTLFGYSISRLNFSKSIKYTIVITIFLYFYIFSFGRALLWRDTSSLWMDALEKYPRSTRILNNLGTSYMGKGKFDRAKHFLELSLKNNPYQFSSYHNLGIILYNENNYQEAIQRFLTVTKINPEYPYSYYYLGLCYEKLGDEMMKEKYLQKARKLSFNLLAEPPLIVEKP
ncbi:MAG TPA: tetratricopeptide repeat protein [Nitrospinota bacterium]|nr:tetratricopeptide repeat protein [Nitrospinota bacterium]